MRTEYITREKMELLLRAMSPENARVIRLSMDTGFRLSDCLSLRWRDLPADGKTWDGSSCTPDGRPTGCPMMTHGASIVLTECKTGKRREAVLTEKACDLLRRQWRLWGKSPWVFPGRDWRKHRTRQAVWKDLKEVSRTLRIDGKKVRENLGPHSARKIFAVDLYHRTGDLEAVRKALNHTDQAVTMLYALADQLTTRELSVDGVERELSLDGK